MSFLPDNFKISNWDNLKPYYESLLEREVGNEQQLKQWFQDRSDLESAISEDLAWRYIKMSCNTNDPNLQEDYEYFLTEIQPHLSNFDHQLNQKVLNSPFHQNIKEEPYLIMLRHLKNSFDLFREENIPLQTEEQKKAKEFSRISGAMAVTIDGEEMTLQQAGKLLESNHRAKRESAWMAINERRIKDKDKINVLLDDLMSIRHQIALNSGFENYRDYKFRALGRFDYTREDVFDFHKAISSEVVPLLDLTASKRKEKMELGVIRPWDNQADPDGLDPLKPFDTSKEFLEKSIKAFGKIDQEMGSVLETMDQMGHFDLESRKGKAPGGYNYPLAQSGYPFVFMNASGTLRDLVTLMHEGGHAVHSVLTKDLHLLNFKHPGSEVAELASMSMELISMDHWNEFFEDAPSLKRAKINHLEQVIETLPWVAIVDKFQHWIYENPNHTHEERAIAWSGIFNEFSDNIVSWEGLEIYKNHLWQKQIHIFEYPFYYIEYGMAQLGAIALWKNYKDDPVQALSNYKKALSLGNTTSIPGIYEAAGIKFDFSRDYISQLMAFVKEELKSLY